MFAFFLWHVEHLSMEWLGVYHIGAIAAQFQAKVVFVCELILLTNNCSYIVDFFEFA